MREAASLPSIMAEVEDFAFTSFARMFSLLIVSIIKLQGIIEITKLRRYENNRMRNQTTT